jgi:hypothetical protein
MSRGVTDGYSARIHPVRATLNTVDLSSAVGFRPTASHGGTTARPPPSSDTGWQRRWTWLARPAHRSLVTDSRAVIIGYVAMGIGLIA